MSPNYDGWDGAHPRVFTRKHKPYVELESGEEINNWLLVNSEFRVHMSRPAARSAARGRLVFFALTSSPAASSSASLCC